ncbi:MAG TPA: HK97 family phage prohead protease [Pseudonocardiaceae bacterium]|nr:HK97 family phage prohead protease [Pseudonocardiaceae bacterium]
MNTTMRLFTIKLRAEMDGNGLTGIASVFGQVADTDDGPEMFDAGAFDRLLSDPDNDTVSLFNHNPDYLLGRQSAGTLQVRAGAEGLHFHIPDLPDTQWGHDVGVLVARGDLNGGSVGFMPGESELRSVDGLRVRAHTDVARLRDLGPVTFPAYHGTNGSMAMRSLTEFGRPTTARSQLIRARARVMLPERSPR